MIAFHLEKPKSVFQDWIFFLLGWALLFLTLLNLMNVAFFQNLNSSFLFFRELSSIEYSL